MGTRGLLYGSRHEPAPTPTCFGVMAYSRERRTGKFCGSVHATISAVKNAAITIPEVPIATKNCEKES